jgi:hypothetical protein
LIRTSFVSGKKYCDDCICFDCGKPLDEGFFEEGNLRFCEDCNKKKDQNVPKPARKFISAHKVVTNNRVTQNHQGNQLQQNRPLLLMITTTMITTTTTTTTTTMTTIMIMTTDISMDLLRKVAKRVERT